MDDSNRRRSRFRSLYQSGIDKWTLIWQLSGTTEFFRDHSYDLKFAGHVRAAIPSIEFAPGR
jgi:hypothetical protein